MWSIIGIILLVIVGFIVLYFITAFILSRIPVKGEVHVVPEMEIFIMTNGDHTDIVVPVRNEQIDWSNEIKFENTLSKDTTYSYVAIGWGDKGFYLDTPTWSQLKLSVAFKAVFWLSTTAMHATYYKEIHVGKNCKRIPVSKEQYSLLIDYITNRFRKDAEGHFINIKTDANYGDSDAFYEAKGRYNLFFTCNTWVNDGLKYAGLRHCIWTVFDTGLFMLY